MIIYLGDVHGDFKIIKKLSNLLKAGDSIVQVGDLGIGMVYGEKLKYYGDLLKRKEINFYAIRGNHDQPSQFYKRNRWGNIQLISDNSAMIIEGKLHYFYGGATSVDRVFRTQGIDWWKDEIPTDPPVFINENKPFVYNQQNEIIGELGEFKDGKIDVMVTHTCPPNVFPVEPPNKDNSFLNFYFEKDENLLDDLIKETGKLNKFQKVMTSKYRIDHWFFGHFHTSSVIKNNDTKYRCLDINEAYAILG